MIASILFDSNVYSVPIALLLVLIGNDKVFYRKGKANSKGSNKPVGEMKVKEGWKSRGEDFKKTLPITVFSIQKHSLNTSNEKKLRSSVKYAFDNVHRILLEIECFDICVSLVFLSLSGQCHQLNENCAL